MIDAVEQWRTRDLSEEIINYIFLDVVAFDMCIDGNIEKAFVLVAIGVTKIGKRLVLGFQAGDEESAPTCWEFFKDLQKRGLDGSAIFHLLSSAWSVL
ncbi:MAG: transposase [Thermodesulfobacteriota bacterium]|nr:transposase [Thermodesulfobacteriota bacterium]